MNKIYLKYESRLKPTCTPQLTKDSLIPALLLSLFLLSGCGAKSTARNTPSSAPPPLPIGGGPVIPGGSDINGAAPAECNHFDARGIRLAGKVTAYYANSQFQEDRVRLRITGLSEKFDESATVKLQLFRWSADDAGTVDIDQTPLDFVIHKETSNSSTPLSGILNSINYLDVAHFRQAGAIPGTTSAEFFQNVTLVVAGVDYKWDALKLVMYNDSMVVGQVDFLIPVFAANPIIYSRTHPELLNKIHPFYADRDQTTATEEQWYSRAQSFCF